MAGGKGQSAAPAAPAAPVAVAPAPPPAPTAPAPDQTSGDANAAANAKLRALAGQQSTILNTQSLGNTSGTAATTPTASSTVLGT